MANSGSAPIVFGGDGGFIGGEGSGNFAPAASVLWGATQGNSYNALPDSEDLFGSAYWGAPSGNFSVGTSIANTGHTDYGFWNTGSAVACASGSIASANFTLPAGTYTISAQQLLSGATTTGCSSPYANVALFVGGMEKADLYNNKKLQQRTDIHSDVSIDDSMGVSLQWIQLSDECLSDMVCPADRARLGDDSLQAEYVESHGRDRAGAD